MDIRGAGTASREGMLRVPGVILRCAAYGATGCSETYLFIDGFPIFRARLESASIWRLNPFLRIPWAKRSKAVLRARNTLESVLKAFAAWLSKSALANPWFAVEMLAWEEGAFGAILRAFGRAAPKSLYLAMLVAVRTACGESQTEPCRCEKGVCMRLCGFSTVDALGCECLLFRKSKGNIPRAIVSKYVAGDAERFEILEVCGRGENPYDWAAHALARRYGALLRPDILYRSLEDVVKKQSWSTPTAHLAQAVKCRLEAVKELPCS